MKRKIVLFNFTILLTCFTIFFCNIFAEPVTEASTEAVSEAPSVINNYAEASKQLEIGSEACILVDAETGIVIYEKNSRERLYPASITKILTAYIACEEGNFDDTLTISQTAVDTMGEGGSSIGLVPGEEISFEDGLYGVLLESANEVCGAIAEHISGSIPAFVEKMNAKVKELGCTDTHFANPHGFHDPNHYTNCYDMSIIARAAIKNLDFSQIWGTVSHNIPPTNKNVARYLHHKDKMLRPTSDFYYEYARGGKTGFHDEAGHTLVTYGEKDGIGLIAVTMKDDSGNFSYSDTKTLLDYGFTLYEDKEIFNGESYASSVPVVQEYNGNEYTVGNVELTAADNINVKLPKFVTADKITVKPEMADKLTAPVTAGSAVGTINVYYNENLLGSTDILAIGDVSALSQKELSLMELKANAKRFIVFSARLFICLFGLFILVLLIDAVRKLFRRGKKKKKRRRKKKRAGKPSSGASQGKGGSSAPKKRKPSPKSGAKKKRPQPPDEAQTKKSRTKTNSVKTYERDMYGVPKRRRAQHRKR